MTEYLRKTIGRRPRSGFANVRATRSTIVQCNAHIRSALNLTQRPIPRNNPAARALYQYTHHLGPSIVEKEIVELLPKLRRFAFGLTTDLDEADDLVQSACLRALTKQETWQPGTRLDSWLYRIIQNLFRDDLRRRKVRGDPIDPEMAVAVPDPKAHLRIDINDRLSDVARVLALIPEEQREVLMLVTVSGFSYQEAADHLSLPVGTVMSRLARARCRLHELIRESEPVGEQTTLRVHES